MEEEEQKTESQEELPVKADGREKQPQSAPETNVPAKGTAFARVQRQGTHKNMEALGKQVEAKSGTDTKKKKRNFWIKTALMIALIAISIFLMFGITGWLGGDGASFSEMIVNVNWAWFGILIAVILAAMIAESAKYSYLLKISTGKWHVKTSVKTMFLGKYYDGITPLGTGGQPFQIYYLHKKNIPAGVATSVPLVRYIVCTIVFCLAAIGLFIAANFVVAAGTVQTTVMIVAWISMFANFAIPVAIVIASLFPRAGKKLIAGIVHLLAKMHIVKKKYTVMKKYVREMEEYRYSLKSLFRQFWKLIPLVLISLVEVLSYVTIPFCTVIALANITPTWSIFLQISCLSMLSFYAASLVPTPGNTGANEAASVIVFNTVSNITAVKPVISWIVLVWRFFIFYIYILSGIGINIFEIIRSAVRARRAAKAK